MKQGVLTPGRVRLLLHRGVDFFVTVLVELDTKTTGWPRKPFLDKVL